MSLFTYSFLKETFEHLLQSFQKNVCSIIRLLFCYNIPIIRITLIFLYKQPVYKQLALRWQAATQLSGLNLLSLSNNKNYRLKESGVFPL